MPDFSGCEDLSSIQRKIFKNIVVFSNKLSACHNFENSELRRDARIKILRLSPEGKGILKGRSGHPRMQAWCHRHWASQDEPAVPGWVSGWVRVTHDHGVLMLPLPALRCCLRSVDRTSPPSTCCPPSCVWPGTQLPMSASMWPSPYRRSGPSWTTGGAARASHAVGRGLF